MSPKLTKKTKSSECWKNSLNALLSMINNLFNGSPIDFSGRRSAKRGSNFKKY